MFNKNEHVRENTSEKINRRIDQEIQARVRYLSLKKKADIQERLDELDKEWDIERTLEVNAGTIAFTGILLSTVLNKKWLILPGIVTAFLVQHAIQGWCPPLPLFRKMGVRTKSEIERERTALKALRGDFERITQEKDEFKRADKVLEAVSNGKE